MECSHRDHGGRRWSLCLKQNGKSQGVRDCDLDRMEYCEERTVDEGVRVLTDSFIRTKCNPCAYCGGNHVNLKRHLVCERIFYAEEIIRGAESELPECTPRLQISTWPHIRGMVLDRDSHSCLGCGVDLSARPEWMREVHHILPRILGGTDDPRNLKTLCNACHRPLTEILMLKMEPKDETERMEADLKRKFRNGRDLLRSLSADGGT